MMRYRLHLSLALVLSLCIEAAAEPAPTIGRLLADGWEIVGLAGNYDVRTSLILFRKKDVNYLVQCSTLYDVTRSQRVVINCYELR
ncbi:hypothetical protein [Methylobacterium radiotolerans]|uniref:hypothetical protein n=1 Tax=Methylobacterium radiotolerans TaxID=31998 RepID=UPI001F212E38|nr:hypothetical protein [Methylobacterium radiotolerans]UIY45580.1 hypothetical protein LZ599_31265 [Methylobacterium radiotolerans]